MLWPLLQLQAPAVAPVAKPFSRGLGWVSKLSQLPICDCLGIAFGCCNSLGVGAGIAPPLTVVNGKASTTVQVFSSPGTYSYWAQYLGDSHNSPSQSSAALFEVVTGSTQINFTGQTGGLVHQGSVQINLQ